MTVDTPASAARALDSWPAWPSLHQGDLELVRQVLGEEAWGGVDAHAVRRFEGEWARFIGVNHALTCSNGTISLTMALQALGIGRGDEVIVPSYTFYATATSVLTAHAIPVFADVELDTCNIDPAQIEAHITPRTKAVIVVHFAGLSVDLDRIGELCARHGIHLVEDAAHAHGAEWQGRKLGSFGAVASWSFQSSKNMTSGEGGALTTKDPEVAQGIDSLRNCGRIPSGAWYEHHVLGANHRLTAIQATLLSAALRRLPGQLSRREENAALLDSALSGLPGISVQARDLRATTHAHHLYVFRYAPDNPDGLSRKDFVERLKAMGIPASTGYPMPLHSQPVFSRNNFDRSVVGWDEAPQRQSYNELVLPGVTSLCHQAVWLPHRLLLAEPDRMQEVISAVRIGVGA